MVRGENGENQYKVSMWEEKKARDSEKGFFDVSCPLR